MKSRIVIVVLGTILSLLNVGCEEVIAKKISSETPVLIVPSVNDTVQFNPVQFKWEKMDGATEYRLQVVTPGFSNISYFTLDTIVTGTEFYAALDSAQYELKLTALNAGYESQTLGPIPFWVGIQPSGGSGTSVVLSTPLSGEYKQDGYSGPFSWNALTMATSYEFSLRQGSSFATGTPVHFQNGISTTNLSQELCILTPPIRIHLQEICFLQDPLNRQQWFFHGVMARMSVLSNHQLHRYFRLLQIPDFPLSGKKNPCREVLFR
jgi:hypothetical protein